MLRESAGMLGRRRKDAGDRTLARLPDTAARLVCFTIVTRTRSGRSKSTQVRVLTTLLDPAAFPAREIAECYSRRWVPGPCPAGGLGAAAHPQPGRDRGRPRRRPGRHRPAADPVRPRARPHPRPRHRGRPLPALRNPPSPSERPGQCPDRRHRQTAPPPGRTTADVSQDPRRAPHRPHRERQLHHHRRKVEPPRMGRNSEYLREVR